MPPVKGGGKEKGSPAKRKEGKKGSKEGGGAGKPLSSYPYRERRRGKWLLLHFIIGGGGGKKKVGSGSRKEKREKKKRVETLPFNFASLRGERKEPSLTIRERKVGGKKLAKRRKEEPFLI